MQENEKKRPARPDPPEAAGEGVAIGLCLGLLFGTAMDNLALGLVFGLLLGVGMDHFPGK